MSQYSGQTKLIRQNYSLIMINLSSFRQFMSDRMPLFYHELHITHNEFEDLYDWVVAEALHRILSLSYYSEVRHHYRHDIYELAYKLVSITAEGCILQQIEAHKLHFMAGEKVKLLVAGDSVIIGRGFPRIR